MNINIGTRAGVIGQSSVLSFASGFSRGGFFSKLDFGVLQYALLAFSYLLVTAFVYPSMWVGLSSLLIHLGWKFRIEAFRFIPLLALPYLLSPLAQSSKYIILAVLCSLIYSFWGSKGWGSWGQTGPVRNFRWGALVVHLAVIFTLIGSFNAFRLHFNFQTFDYDLGVFDNIFFNMMEGRGMYNPLERDDPDGSHFKVHFSPSLYLLLPFYGLFPRAEMLQFLQFALIGGAGIALYFLLKERCGAKISGVLASAWIFYPPLLGGAFYDFHELCLGPLLLFLTGLSMVYRQKVLPWVLALLTLGVKEDFSLFVGPAFILFGIWGGRLKTGIGMAVLSLIFFLSVRFLWIIPHGENWFHIYHRLGAGSFSDLLSISLTQPWIIVEAIIRPPATLTFFELFTPLCFIPLFSGWTYVLMFLPTLALFAGDDPMKTNHFQYTLLLAPMIFLGLGDLFLRNTAKSGWLTSIILLTLLSQVGAGLLSTNGFRSGFNDVTLPVPWIKTGSFTEIQQIKKMIPADASTASPPQVSAHFSNRSDSYTTKNWTQDAFSKRAYRRLPLFIITVSASHLDPSSRYTSVFNGEHFKLWKRN